MGRVVRVHGVPPHRFTQRDGLVGRFQYADGRERGQEPGQAGLDEGDAPGSGDQQRDALEAVDGDLGPGLDSQHAELAHGRGVVGALVGDPGQPGQVLAGEPVADAGMVLGDEEDPPVRVQVGGGEAADDSVRHQQAVGRAQQRVRGVHHRGRGLREAQPDARGLLVHDPGQFGAEDRDGVVGREQLELPPLPGGIEVRLAGEEAFQHVVRRGGAVQKDLAEGGQLVVATDPREQVVVEVAAQAGQGRAHRGLAEADALPGTGDVAFLEKRPQGDDEIEVQTTEIHGPFPGCTAMTSENPSLG